MLSGLTGLRGLAAIIVVYYHLNQQRTTSELSQLSWDIYLFTENLVFVVSLFFVFSGFFRALTYWKKIDKNESTPKLGPSIKDRFTRIAPLYYLALVITFCYSIIYFGISLESIIRLLSGVFFVNWISSVTLFPVDYNGPLWFVAYDMFGWIVVSIFMMIVARYGKRYFLVLFSLLTSLLLICHYGFVAMPWGTSEGVGGSWFPLYNPFLFTLHFMVGVLAAYIYNEIKKLHIRSNVLFDLFTVLLFSILGYFLWYIRESPDWSYSIPTGPYQFPLIAVMIGSIIILLPFTRYLGRIIDNSIFAFYGRISYALFLFHTLVIVLLRQYIYGWEQFDIIEWYYFSLITFVVSTILAYGLTRWFEPLFHKD